jgi:MFS family permease
MASRQKPRRTTWIYSVFPVAIATGPLGAIVQLYLIHLNGQVLGTIYAGLAVAIYNGISIPAALFWGFATDRLHKRRALIALSYSLMAVALVSFYFDRTTTGTISIYSIISFVSVASATPLNLLIMETQQKSRWAAAFAKLSMVSSIGNVAGLLLSAIWSDLFPSNLILLFVPMGAFSVASSVLALVTIAEPEFVFERETVALRKPSLFSRLRTHPLFFIAVPTATDFRRIFRGLRSSLTSYLPLFYISTVLFYVSSGLFNTSFVPAMHFFLIPDQYIYIVILAGMAVQTAAFQGAGSYIGSRSLISSSVQGLVLRGWSYFIIGAAALLLSGPLFALPVIIFYPLAGGVAFAIYYTSANTMMFNTVQVRGGAGAALGVYSAVVGVATMAGSFVSGFISVYQGYDTTFVLSAVLLFAAIIVVLRLPRASAPDAGVHR